MHPPKAHGATSKLNIVQVIKFLTFVVMFSNIFNYNILVIDITFERW
jgi:hypothetical protein